MKVTVLVWNIWLENQIKGKDSLSSLLKELDRVISLYKPDFIGLNEVVQYMSDPSPFVLDHLKDIGYKYSQYVTDAPWDDDWLVGSALVSRLKFDQINSFKLCKDSSGEKKGYYGYDTKGIKASVVLPNKEKVNVIIAHPLYLRPHTIREHYNATASIRNVVRDASVQENLILAGDFNEPRFMPKSFKNSTSDILNFKSGSLFNATWRHNASRFTPIRANLDQMYWSKKGALRLESFEVVESKISDHKPLVATFVLSKSAA